MSMDMTDEQWKPIPGHDGYEASDKGRLRGIDRMTSHGRPIPGVILTQGLTNRGYSKVNLRVGGNPKTFTVHSLVLLTFVGPRPQDRPHIRHLNDDKSDNRLENICYGTREENDQDRLKGAAPCVDCGTGVLLEHRSRCFPCHRRAIGYRWQPPDLFSDSFAARIRKALNYSESRKLRQSHSVVVHSEWRTFSAQDQEQ